MRKTLVLTIGLVALLAFAASGLAITAEDLDLTGFPEGAKVLQIAQDAEGNPLKLCVRPTRKHFIDLPGPPTIKWIQVPLHGRMEDGWVWVKIEIPNPDQGSTWTVTGMECIRKCPQGASGTRCVTEPGLPCPVCK